MGRDTLTQWEKDAWALYCKHTWTDVAKDFWHELSVREKNYWKTQALLDSTEHLRAY